MNGKRQASTPSFTLSILVLSTPELAVSSSTLDSGHLQEARAALEVTAEPCRPVLFFPEPVWTEAMLISFRLCSREHTAHTAHNGL